MSDYNRYPRDTWLDVDLGQLRRNIEIIGEIAGVSLLVVVKANAYGHGLLPCARVAEACGVRMLGVATIGEACLLQEAGIETAILRITAYGPDEMEPMIRSGVHFFVWREDQIKGAGRIAARLGVQARVHLKVDTGFGRLGLFPEDAPGVVRVACAEPGVVLEGVCSHFHSADAEDISSAQMQMQRFNHVVEMLETEGICPSLVHLANSPGLLRFPEARYNMVRTGVITYGMPYEDGFPLPEGIHEIAQWKARIVSVRTLPRGHVVGYGAQYVTQEKEKIGIIPAGYADGLHRFPANVNEVLLSGRIVPVVGRVCMDQAMIRIPSDMDVAIGQEVVILGEQDGGCIGSLDIARRWGTNNYDVVCNIAPRVPRVYV